MKLFLLVVLLALGMIVGPILALRPTPRQAQIARLRARAVASGLRVHLASVSPPRAEYVMPWRLEDRESLDAAPLPTLTLTRSGDRWIAQPPVGHADASAVRQALRRLPPAITSLSVSSEGIAAAWDERGRESDVQEIAAALQALRGAWLADVR